MANFLNSELYGKETSVAWGVIFSKVDNLSRHPSQLYEAGLEGIILFLVLIILAQNNILKKKGFMSAIFLFLYSIFRFYIEFYREPDIQVGYLIFNLTMGQSLCFIFFIIGVFLIKRNER